MVGESYLVKRTRSSPRELGLTERKKASPRGREISRGEKSLKERSAESGRERARERESCPLNNGLLLLL